MRDSQSAVDRPSEGWWAPNALVLPSRFQTVYLMSIMRELRKTFVDKFQKLSLWERASINSGILIKLNIYIYACMYVRVCTWTPERSNCGDTQMQAAESLQRDHILSWIMYVYIYIYIYYVCVRTVLWTCPSSDKFYPHTDPRTISTSVWSDKTCL